MALHETAFKYLTPTDSELETMETLRAAFVTLADEIEALVPDGADKTYVLRHLRECAMWAMVAITRNADGEPRQS